MHMTKIIIKLKPINDIDNKITYNKQIPNLFYYPKTSKL